MLLSNENYEIQYNSTGSIRTNRDKVPYVQETVNTV